MNTLYNPFARQVAGRLVKSDKRKQAGAELCQAQDKFSLVWIFIQLIFAWLAKIHHHIA